MEGGQGVWAPALRCATHKFLAPDWSDQVLAVVVIQKMNQEMEDLSLSL